MGINTLIANYKNSIASPAFRRNVITPLLEDLQDAFKADSERKPSGGKPEGIKKQVSFDEKAKPSARLRNDLAYLSEIQSNARRFKTLNKRAAWYNVGATAMNVGFIAGTFGALAPISGPFAAVHVGLASLHYRWQRQASKTWSAIKSSLEQNSGVEGLNLKRLSYYNDKLAKNTPAFELARSQAVRSVLGTSVIDDDKIKQSIDRKKWSRDLAIYKIVMAGKLIRKPFSKSVQNELSDYKQVTEDNGQSRYAQWVGKKADRLFHEARDFYDDKGGDDHYIG